MYDVACEGGMTQEDNANVRKIVLERAEFIVLDFIMRNFVLIHFDPDLKGVDSELKGANPHQVVSRVRTFLTSKGQMEILKTFLLSDEGRSFFFDKFREAFFDNSMGDRLLISKSASHLTGRIQEGNDYFDDLPQRYVKEFIKSGYKFKNAL